LTTHLWRTQPPSGDKNYVGGNDFLRLPDTLVCVRQQPSILYEPSPIHFENIFTTANMSFGFSAGDITAAASELLASLKETAGALSVENKPWDRSEWRTRRNQYFIPIANFEEFITNRVVAHELYPGMDGHQLTSYTAFKCTLARRIFSILVLVPVENVGGKITHHDLHENALLPFIEDHDREQTNAGGYSQVWRVRIHAAHQMLSSIEPKVSTAT
jgi:hypothetical protein